MPKKFDFGLPKRGKRSFFGEDTESIPDNESDVQSSDAEDSPDDHRQERGRPRTKQSRPTIRSRRPLLMRADGPSKRGLESYTDEDFDKRALDSLDAAASLVGKDFEGILNDDTKRKKLEKIMLHVLTGLDLWQEILMAEGWEEEAPKIWRLVKKLRKNIDLHLDIGKVRY